jgi:hypothetical protein
MNFHYLKSGYIKTVILWRLENVETKHNNFSANYYVVYNSQLLSCK